MTFFFNVPCQFTPPLNEDPVIFGLTPFDWLRTRTLSCNSCCEGEFSHRDIDGMEHVSSAKSTCKLFTVLFKYSQVEQNIVYLYTNINNTIIIIIIIIIIKTNACTCTG
jgi:hypothetical protein